MHAAVVIPNGGTNCAAAQSLPRRRHSAAIFAVVVAHRSRHMVAHFRAARGVLQDFCHTLLPACLTVLATVLLDSPV
jgi:hypothetical protein